MTEEKAVVAEKFYLVSYLGNIAGITDGYETVEEAKADFERKSALGFVGVIVNKKYPAKPTEFKNLMKDLIVANREAKRSKIKLQNFQVSYDEASENWVIESDVETVPGVKFFYQKSEDGKTNMPVFLTMDSAEGTITSAEEILDRFNTVFVTEEKPEKPVKAPKAEVDNSVVGNVDGDADGDADADGSDEKSVTE